MLERLREEAQVGPVVTRWLARLLDLQCVVREMGPGNAHGCACLPQTKLHFHPPPWFARKPPLQADKVGISTEPAETGELV